MKKAKQTLIAIILTTILSLITGCAPNKSIEASSGNNVSLLQTNKNNAYLNVFDLSDGTLVLEDKLGTTNEFFYQSCFIDGKTNVFTYNNNETIILEKGKEKIVIKNQRNIAMQALSESKILSVEYDNNEDLFFVIRKVENPNEQIKEIALSGNFSDFKINKSNNTTVMVLTYDKKEKATFLYEIFLDDYNVNKVKLFDFPALVKGVKIEEKYFLTVGDKIVGDSKKEKINKMYALDMSNDAVSEIATLTGEPFAICSYGNQISYIVDRNNPHLYITDISLKSIVDFELAAKNVYGLKEINNILYVFGNQAIYKLDGKQLKVLTKFSKDNLRTNIDLY